jgi:hypothetical protein
MPDVRRARDEVQRMVIVRSILRWIIGCGSFAASAGGA